MKIPVGTPCEVQIRTLLQHSQSELTHDRIYKSKVKASPKVRRAATKAVALVEVMSDLFTKVDDEMTEVMRERNDLEQFLKKEFYSHIPEAQDLFSDRFNDFLIDGLINYMDTNLTKIITDLQGFLNDKSYIFDKIRGRREDNIFYAQPATLLAYLVVNKYHRKLLQNIESDSMILSRPDLELMISDLGKRLS